MTLRVVSENDPLDLSWLAFDRAALKLGEMYRDPSAYSAADRQCLAAEVSQLWDTWKALFLSEQEPSEPRPAA